MDPRLFAGIRRLIVTTHLLGWRDYSCWITFPRTTPHKRASESVPYVLEQCARSGEARAGCLPCFMQRRTTQHPLTAYLGGCSSEVRGHQLRRTTEGAGSRCQLCEPFSWCRGTRSCTLENAAESTRCTAPDQCSEATIKQQSCAALVRPYPVTHTEISEIARPRGMRHTSGFSE